MFQNLNLDENKRSYQENLALMMMYLFFNLVSLTFSYDFKGNFVKEKETINLLKLILRSIKKSNFEFKALLSIIEQQFEMKYGKFIKEWADMNKFFRIIFPTILLNRQDMIFDEMSPVLQDLIRYANKRSKNYTTNLISVSKESNKIPLKPDIDPEKLSPQKTIIKRRHSQNITNSSYSIFQKAISELEQPSEVKEKPYNVNKKRNSIPANLPTTSTTHIKTEESCPSPTKKKNKFLKSKNKNFFNLLQDLKNSAKRINTLSQLPNTNQKAPSLDKFFNKKKNYEGIEEMDNFIQSMVFFDLDYNNKNEDISNMSAKIENILKKEELEKKMASYSKKEMKFKNSVLYNKRFFHPRDTEPYIKTLENFEIEGIASKAKVLGNSNLEVIEKAKFKRKQNTQIMTKIARKRGSNSSLYKKLMALAAENPELNTNLEGKKLNSTVSFRGLVKTPSMITEKRKNSDPILYQESNQVNVELIREFEEIENEERRHSVDSKPSSRRLKFLTPQNNLSSSLNSYSYKKRGETMLGCKGAGIDLSTEQVKLSKMGRKFVMSMQKIKKIVGKYRINA